MTTFVELLSFVTTILQTSPLCEYVRIVETHPFSKDQFALKVRARLIEGSMFQVHLYYNQDHIDYAYQLVQNEEPVLRWDNKEHFPTLSSYPHHFHTASGLVEGSPLIGNPIYDLPFVLDYLTSALN